MPRQANTRQSMSADDVSSLLLHLYRGITETPPWQSWLGDLRRHLHADCAILLLRKPAADDLGVIVTDGLDESTRAPANPYATDFHAQDPFVNLPPGKVVSLADYLPPAELRNSDFYAIGMAPWGIFHLIGVDLVLSEGLYACLRLARPEHKPDFSAADKRQLGALVNHFQLALGLYHRLDQLEAERGAYATAVTGLSVATILLDDRGEVLHTNPVADALLAERDGIRLAGKRLALAREQDTQRLRQFITGAIAASRRQDASMAQAMSVTRPSGRPALGMVARPVTTGRWSAGQGRPCVALYISDPDRQTGAARDQLEHLFGLSRAEAGLALCLANGLSLDQSAERLHISRNTARAHLRSIFAKTGVSRQPMLVRLVLQSVAKLG